jgi:hypothetical protein
MKQIAIIFVLWQLNEEGGGEHISCHFTNRDIVVTRGLSYDLNFIIKPGYPLLIVTRLKRLVVEESIV